MTGIGSWIVSSMQLHIPNGKESHCVIFQALFIVTGMIRADGAYLQSIFIPFLAKGLGMPFLLLVPSGKIIAALLFFSMYCPISLIADRDCLGLLRTISADPP